MKKLSYILLIIFAAGLIIFSFGNLAKAADECKHEGESPCGYVAPSAPVFLCCEGEGLTCKNYICQTPKVECPSDQICIENPLEAESFEGLLDAIVNFIFWIAIAVAPIMIMIAAFFLLTAGGDPKRIDTAKQIILWTVIGLAIVLFAKGLISVLRQIIGVK